MESIFKRVVQYIQTTSDRELYELQELVAAERRRRNYVELTERMLNNKKSFR